VRSETGIVKELISRVLRRISAPKGYEVIGGWKKLDNEELHSLYASSNFITTIKSRIYDGRNM
jgi:hypothetical protein